MMIRITSAVLLAAVIYAGPAGAGGLRVLASIAPVHSLTAAVMAGVGEPELLVPVTMSDHDYALKPSDIRKIAAADLIIWIGDSLETYLHKPIETEAVANLELLSAAGVEAHAYAAEGDRDPHDAEANEGGATGEADETIDEATPEHEHAHIGYDPHVWLDPVRAQALVAAIADELAALDPANAEIYRRNAAAAQADLKALDAEIRTLLSGLSDRPFITFHDGYRYFVERYRLNQVGEATIDPDRRPGPATLASLRKTVAQAGAVCAFAEPQFPSSAIETLAGDTGIRIAVLDAIGADIAPGASLYPKLLRRNAAAMKACLSPIS